MPRADRRRACRTSARSRRCAGGADADADVGERAAHVARGAVTRGLGGTRQMSAAAPCDPVLPLPPEENSILGVIYGGLLWADMNAATPPGSRGRSALCAGGQRLAVGTRPARGQGAGGTCRRSTCGQEHKRALRLGSNGLSAAQRWVRWVLGAALQTTAMGVSGCRGSGVWVACGPFV